MTVEDDNVATLREAYRRWAAGKGADCDCWISICDDTVSLSSIADGAPGMEFSSRRSTKAELMGYFRDLARDWEMLSFEMDEFVAQGDRVVAIGRCAWRNKQTGKVAETPKIDLWRFKEGKVVAMSEFYDTARAFAAAQP